MLADLIAGVRFIRDLKPYVRSPLALERGAGQIRAQLAQRAHTFLEVLRVAVYGHEASPYRKLLAYYDITHEDIVGRVYAHGVEGALERLYDDGVYITLDQFKGRAPIERPGLHLEVSGHDFDSPFLGNTFAYRSGGSRGTARRVRVDPASLAYEATYNLIGFRALGVEARPFAMWRPIPPASAGIKDMLRQVMGGMPVTRWFSQTDPGLRSGQHAALTRLVIMAIRHWGAHAALPVYAPADAPDQVARWLAAQVASGDPAFISMTGSAAVRVCTCARAQGLDITGTVFRLGSEPYTPARAEILALAGASGASNYSMSELGRIGQACGAPQAVDDAHLVTDKLALIQRPPPTGGHSTATDISAWYLTTLLAALPKIMLNVETGDYGVVEQRDCGCLLGELGLTTHLHTIRSYEKLTSEGMHFTGALLLRLIEEVLPAQVGGDATSYQLVEQEVAGMTRVSLIVSPQVGEIDEARVIALALHTLAGNEAGTRMMAGIWERAGTLQILRREPYVTAAAKILPLHVQSGSL